MKDADVGILVGFVIGMLIMAVISIIVIAITLDLPPTCLEDEVAIHGGIENYYDRHDALECVNIEEFLDVLR